MIVNTYQIQCEEGNEIYIKYTMDNDKHKMEIEGLNEITGSGYTKQEAFNNLNKTIESTIYELKLLKNVESGNIVLK